MKYKTFESLLNTCKKLYEDGSKKDEQLTKAFGGDTTILQDWWDNSIVDILNSISNEFGLDTENDNTIDWLFWDSMCGYDMNNRYLSFNVDGIEYVGSPKNVYLDLNNMLDERLGITKVNSEPKKYEIDKDYKEEKIETHFIQTKEIKDVLNGETVKETPRERIIRYFISAGIEVLQKITDFSKETVLSAEINVDNLYDEIKELGYDKQLFRINLLDVKTLNNKYNIDYIKL